MKNYVRLFGSVSVVIMAIGCGGKAPAPPAPPAAQAPAPAPAPAAGKTVVLPPSDQVQTYRYEDAKIELTIPAKWSLVKENNYLEIMSPGEELYVEFQILAAAEIEPALKETIDYLNSKIPDVKMGEPKEGTENGMPSWSITGTSEAQELAVGIILFQTPANKLLSVYVEATPEAEKFQADIDLIDKGIKPLK